MKGDHGLKREGQESRPGEESGLVQLGRDAASWVGLVVTAEKDRGISAPLALPPTILLWERQHWAGGQESLEPPYITQKSRSLSGALPSHETFMTF
jgi:hypothetical protein